MLRSLRTVLAECRLIVATVTHAYDQLISQISLDRGLIKKPSLSTFKTAWKSLAQELEVCIRDYVSGVAFITD